MAEFIIYKRSFFYTDDAYELIEGVMGSVVSTFDNLEVAKLEKEKQDIISIQNLTGSVVNFISYGKIYDEIYQKLENYYKSEFDLTISDKYYFEFPNKINEEQAKIFLNILEISFHEIVEYSEDDGFNTNDFIIGKHELEEF